MHQVADAIISGRLSGVEHSSKFLTDAEAWIDGTIDDVEFMEHGLRRWRPS